MRRRLFALLSLLSLLSLLLCVATVVLWVRSYTSEQNLQFGSHTSCARFCAWYGEVGVELSQDVDALGVLYWRTNMESGEAEYSNDHELIVESIGRRAGLHDFYGFRWHVNYGDTWYAERGVALPIWFLVLLTALLPLGIGIQLLVQYRRPGVGICHRCSYSLTGNTSGVCPECGTVVRSGQLESPDATFGQVTKQ